MLYGLQPVYAKHSRAMILGSMPSALSLQKGQYYGNPRNGMWPILFSLLGEPSDRSMNSVCKWFCVMALPFGIWPTLVSGKALRTAG